MPPDNRNKHHQARAPRGHVAELTAEGQVKKVVADIENLTAGDNLRCWSASARKELTSMLCIPFRVGTDPLSRVYFPKQALLVASPIVRAYFQQNSTASTAKFTHKDISFDAIREIAKWLKAVCLEPVFPELAMPENFRDAMKLRLTAHTLGMERYVEHFDAYYIEDTNYHVPSLQEITDVVNYTRKNDDVILVVLANRLGYLCKYHKIPKSDEEAIAKLLVDAKYGRLLAAVQSITNEL